MDATSFTTPAVPPNPAPEVPPLKTGTEFPPAARIQVAAVVAQQAALAEVEWRLHQEQQSHQQQHAQLAQYLNDRHHELTAQEEELSESHAEVARQRLDHDTHLRFSHQQLQAQSSQIDQREQTTLAEREAVRQLRRRFIQRWKRHWATERRRLVTQAESQNREAARLLADRERFDRFRLKFNGQMELERRQLGEQREQVEAARRTLQLEKTALETERRQLDRQRATVEQLRSEADALETRIAHQREMLSGLQPTAFFTTPAFGPPLQKGTDAIPVASTYNEPTDADRLMVLNCVADVLSDQRRVLVEQCQRFDTLRSDELKTLTELETLTQDLIRQQAILHAAQQEWQAGHSRRQAERAELARQRQQIEGQWLRYYNRVNRSQANEQRLQAELAQREQHIAERETSLNSLMQNWNARRKTEADRVSAELERCAQLHAAWRDRLEAEHHRERSLITEQQRVAEQTIVLEEARREFLRENPLASEKKLQRLHQRLKESLARREAEILQRELQQQMCREEIEEGYQELRRRSEYLMSLEVRVEETQTAQSAARYQLKQALADRDYLRARWDDQQARYTHQIDELEAEVERVAAMLIELAPDEEGESSQAA